MTRREALYQAVLDDPSADAPRLAYAAFCDAHGDRYGAFIRAQLAWTNEARNGLDERVYLFRRQAENIQRRHGKPEWTHGVEEWGVDPDFLRGFVDRVRIDARVYLERKEELYRRVPVRILELTDVGELAPQIASDPHLGQLVSLSITGKQRIGDVGLAALATSPYLRALKILNVCFQNLTMIGLEALCQSKQFPSLAHVHFAGNQFPDPIEEYGIDGMSGRIVADGISLPPLGKELERKYGYLLWLHGPTFLRHFLPWDEEL